MQKRIKNAKEEWMIFKNTHKPIISQLRKQEHLKYSTYTKDKDECSVHFIQTKVLKKIVIKFGVLRCTLN